MATARGATGPGRRARPRAPSSLEVQREQHLSRFERSVEAVQSGVRRVTGREEPIGLRAAQTRERVLTAADALFAEKGYSPVSVGEIANTAGVRMPTLYQYFSGKSGIIAALVGQRAIEMMAQGVDDWVPESGAAGLRRLIHDFVATYERNRAFFRAWEDATQAEPAIASLRREWNAVYRLRVAESIRAGQEHGSVANHDDAHELARWLTRGLEAYCFDVLVFDPPPDPATVDQITEVITDAWSRTLGVARD